MEKELVRKILGKEAFIVSPIFGGMMNNSFLVVNNDKKYILYIPTEQANEMVDRSLEKLNQQIVYSLGITSKNIYFDVQKGIKMNEYIEGSSIDKINEFDYQKIAKMLKTLHQSPVLSRENYNPFNRFIGYEKEAKEFVGEFEKNYVLLREKLFKNETMLKSQKLVLSHNDAQRSNIIRSENDNYYIIDFEFMGNNDEIYDIACFGNGLVSEGYKLLEAYFGNPSASEKRRYYLWRIYVSLQWYLVALVKHYRGEGAIHNFDFLKVAEHFLNNAKDAYEGLTNI